MEGSKTVQMRSQLHADRWSGLGESAGIRRSSSMLSPAELRGFPIFEGLKDSFLEDISPDVSVVEWDADTVLFEEGSYLDVAFYVESGEVELRLAAQEAASQPIFTTDLSRFPEAERPDDVKGEEVPGAMPSGATVAMRAMPRPEKPREDGQITYLSTMDFDMHRGERLRLGPGEFFGEIGALNGWPQSVTAKTLSRSRLVQIRLPALRKLRRKSKELKARLDELYRSRTLRSHLASTPLLRSCDETVIEALADKVELVSCEPGEVVAVEGDRAEHLLLVRSGFLKLSQKVGEGEVVVSYLSKGTTLGEVELLVDGIEEWQVTTTSVGYSELVRIRRSDFLEVVARQDELERRLWDAAVDRIRELGFTRKHLHRSDLVEFALAKGLVQGNSVLVIDLETCTRCDDCVRGCTETHGGIPRFVREGEKHQGFLVARSCYHCEDPVCLIGCPTGAIHRTNVGAVVDIDPSICIGCSACAQNCPYDAIVMHDLEEKWPQDALPTHLRGQDRFVASKCDLCHKSEAGPACVASCPHGCAFRVSTLDDFDALVEAKLAGGAA